MSFSQWLRSNSENSLLAAAQARVARQKGLEASIRPRGLKDRFWRYVFVPTYYALPDAMRRFAFRVLPGSHRKAWPKQAARPRPAHSSFPAIKS